MQWNNQKCTARERELARRCLFLAAASLFFFMMAACKARSADYYGYQPQPDPWYFADEDEYDIMSADDHIMSSRLNRLVVGNRPVYHKRKASRIHDSVTIIVNEYTDSELNSSNDLSRNSSNNMTLTNWLIPRLSGGSAGLSQRGQAAGGNTPTIQYSNNRAHKSDSTIERSQTFETILTGEVIEVHPNGYLVVEARKTVNINGEEQTVAVTGIVNPEHMDADSSVSAERLMDMNVKYTGSGPMTRMDKRGWGSKLIDLLNPF